MSTKIVNVEEMEWKHGVSPGGKFEHYDRNISVAQGFGYDSGSPFDLAQVRIPPGKTNFPLHQHGAQWESYLIQSGAGEHVIAGEVHAISAGSSYTVPPRTPHQMRNTGAVDLVYLVIANNVTVDTTFYPTTGKWQVKPERKLFTTKPAEYFEGEE